jgi:carbon storage regulator
MLSLLVRQGDYVLIGNDIRIHVQRGVGRNMKIGIDAPKSVPVVRGEVYERSLMEDPYENLEELEANRAKKEDFKKDIERFDRKREGIEASLKTARSQSKNPR